MEKGDKKPQSEDKTAAARDDLLYFEFHKRLQELPTTAHGGIPRGMGTALSTSLNAQLEKLQERLYTAGTHSVLVIMQGIDTSGKDGAVKGVMSGVNPAGVRVESFKVPTELEQRHDFLWRVHNVCPPKGIIGVFNRSHYEDVLVVKLLKLVSDKVIAERYKQVNDFEAMLAANGTIVIKLYLHISKEAQFKRLTKREAEKSWKLDASDWPTHERYTEYVDIHNAAFSHTSTRHAPWYVIPADHKWFRDLAIKRLLLDVLAPYDAKWKEKIRDMQNAKSKYARKPEELPSRSKL